jgi:hypothetical protein
MFNLKILQLWRAYNIKDFSCLAKLQNLNKLSVMYSMMPSFDNYKLPLLQ